jgi:hypothetical protein
MQLLLPTTLQRKKLTEIIKKIFPQYQFVRFGPCGLIFVSKSFWHSLFKREVIHITELCTVLIPERLEELDTRTTPSGEAFPYQRVYNKYSHVVLDLLHHRANSIIDYLYDEYIYVKYNIHKNYYTINDVLPERTYSLSEILLPVKPDSIALSHLSSDNIKQALKRWSNISSVLNHPVLKKDVLNMWFKREIKDQLQQIYDIRIVFS